MALPLRWGSVAGVVAGKRGGKRGGRVAGECGYGENWDLVVGLVGVMGVPPSSPAANRIVMPLFPALRNSALSLAAAVADQEASSSPKGADRKGPFYALAIPSCPFYPFPGKDILGTCRKEKDRKGEGGAFIAVAAAG
eukprot:scaffold32749_cov101-Isochrysis_galbana.AAC.1